MASTPTVTAAPSQATISAGTMDKIVGGGSAPLPEEQSTQLRIEGGGLGGGDSASQLREQLDGPDAVADLEGSESFRGHSRLSERGLKIALSRNPEGQSPAAQTAVNHPGSTLEEKGAQSDLDRQ